ncbi:MAG TPA: hypothetical protein VID47_12465 [Actinomycetota bacterium]|jgi:hypothetical protein
MRRGRTGVAACICAVALLCVGCGGSTNGGGTVVCDGTPLSPDAIRLPADFPIPDAAVLITASKAGPSQVVDGYYRGDLQEAYHGWKDAFETAGYTVIFDEIEVTDSEVAYQSGDGRSIGQVSLRTDCIEDGRTSVHITNRPT